MESKFVTFNRKQIYGDVEDVSPVAINVNQVVSFSPDGENTRIELVSGADKHLLVDSDYKTVYQQVTGKVFLG